MEQLYGGADQQSTSASIRYNAWSGKVRLHDEENEGILHRFVFNLLKFGSRPSAFFGATLTGSIETVTVWRTALALVDSLLSFVFVSP